MDTEGIQALRHASASSIFCSLPGQAAATAEAECLCLQVMQNLIACGAIDFAVRVDCSQLDR